MLGNKIPISLGSEGLEVYFGCGLPNHFLSMPRCSSSSAAQYSSLPIGSRDQGLGIGSRDQVEHATLLLLVRD